VATRPRPLGGGELAQVVDAKALFDVGDFIDHPLEGGLAETSVLLVFKGFSHVPKLPQRAPRRENAGKTTVSSRASCGSYISMNADMSCSKASFARTDWVQPRQW